MSAFGDEKSLNHQNFLLCLQMDRWICFTYVRLSDENRRTAKPMSVLNHFAAEAICCD